MIPIQRVMECEKCGLEAMCQRSVDGEMVCPSCLRETCADVGEDDQAEQELQDYDGE